MKCLVRYFIDRPIIVNALMIGLFLMSFVVWKKIGKEEMPEFAFESIRVSFRYPGASAADVESFIVKPVEEKLKGLTALEEITSSSSYGSATFNVQFEAGVKNLPEKVQEVKDSVDSVTLPSEVDDPIYRQFKSSEKAIIDIGMYLKDVEILEVKDRQKLQEYALGFRDKLLTLPEVSGVDLSGYLRPELQIKVDSEKLKLYEVSMNQLRGQIESQHVRSPIGSLKDKRETEISITSELNSVESLKEVTVISGYQGQKLTLDQIAEVEPGFETSTSISKIQGREGIIFNVQKSSSTDILTAQKAIVDFVKKFEKGSKKSSVGFVLIDDESYDVRNRLDLIGVNGLVGFVLIVIILVLFLDFRSSIWVGMGIPFSLAFTLLGSVLLGYTVNNMTLAAIIIVLGIVVDDAIIIAENISRNFKERNKNKVVDAVVEVGIPVIASILTTCAAFIPLYFFSGRFGLFVKYIPAVIFLMLAASLIESFFFLPSHMMHETKIEKIYKKFFKRNKFATKRSEFISRVEQKYTSILVKVLEKRFYVLGCFVLLACISGYLFKNHLSYVMFPREESRNFRVKVVGPEKSTRHETALLVRQVEDVFLNDEREVVTSVRTSIGQNRRGGEVKENEASIRVEIVAPSEREVSLSDLIKSWQPKLAALTDFQKVQFQKSRFGSYSGSPIAIEVQENNDAYREEIVSKLINELNALGTLVNVEEERPREKVEYRLEINKEQANRLGIKYSQLASSLRAYVEGDVLYTLNDGDEEVDVRFTSKDSSKSDINNLLDLTVENSEGYLVPISSIVKLTLNTKDSSIQRVNFKRATMVYADLAPSTDKTPLEIAELIEEETFPIVLQGRPTSNVRFRGEVEDSRDSQADFALSISIALGLIYLLLIFLFNSFLTPLLVGAIIPFGVIGTIIAFWSHGMEQYGFFAVVGTLGMIGVVVNDSIVLIDRLKSRLDPNSSNLLEDIAKVTSTRLRAVVITTLTTVAGLFPTAYGLGGYDSMLAEMMLAMGWGLLLGMFITLIFVPCIFSLYAQFSLKKDKLETRS